MSLPQYPTALPVPLLSGYALQHGSPFISTQMESGRFRTRRTFSTVPSLVSVTWLFRSDAEAAVFEAWFRDAIADGTQRFEAKLKTPVGLKRYECEFASMYAGPQLVSCYWKYSAQLRLTERPLLPIGYGNFDPSILLLADAVDQAVNHEWPEA